jgi:dihydroorotate dehydrogenase electron transfer subunit
MMTQGVYPVRSVRETAPNIHVLTIHAPRIASSVLAGQFLNIRASDSFVPLLRRPFSVYNREGDDLQVIFNVVGLGTKLLSCAPQGEPLDVLGPLGNGFAIREGFDEAILVAGGLGVAPLPMLAAGLRGAGKPFRTFIGGRNAAQVVTDHLDPVSVATDDGSAGHRGTVVDLLRTWLGSAPRMKRKIFACGPTPMLRALSALAAESTIPCELSLESPMACGIGICQGCPVEMKNGQKKYALICREGTVFNSNDVVL